MSDSMVERLVKYKMLSEMQELEHSRLVNFLKTHHPRVWQGYEQKVLTNIVFGPSKEEGPSDE